MVIPESDRRGINLYEYKFWEIDQIDKLKRIIHKQQLSDEQIKPTNFWKLVDKHTAKAIWYDRVISIAHKLADCGVDSIKTYLEINSNIIDAMARLRIRSARDPLLKSHHRTSHYCVDAIITEGTLREKWKHRKT
ncbi:hypothetical protein NIES2107_63070 [Nostoc carneum NIES-2107]|nr:hypothetical protein NIES2107_63070 [Nostoc carneum NIES-2107]